MSETRTYNRVVRVSPHFEWRGWRPYFWRYEATFYSSAYGMGTVTAWTHRRCTERFNRMCGAFFADDFR